MPRPACLFFKNHSRVSIFWCVYFACLFLCLKIPIHVYLCLFYERILYCFFCAHVCSCLFLIFVSISIYVYIPCLFSIDYVYFSLTNVYLCLFMSINVYLCVFHGNPLFSNLFPLVYFSIIYEKP